MKQTKKWLWILIGILVLFVLVSGRSAITSTLAETTATKAQQAAEGEQTFSLSDVPAYSGRPYIAVTDNTPWFLESDYTTVSFETYSELDALGRCGPAFCNIGIDLMPTEKRGSIGHVKPSGWQTAKYDMVDGKYLYNRCHLVGYQLSGENANERNLITGTRYMNVDGFLPFENMIADYVKETKNHVLYRVTPVFDGNNLLASGVRLEGFSVEDRGEAIQFHVFLYNVQPGIQIDYATGSSALDTGVPAAQTTYVLNKNTKKFHRPSCSSAADIQPENRQEFTGDRSQLISDGYTPCKKCRP